MEMSDLSMSDYYEGRGNNVVSIKPEYAPSVFCAKYDEKNLSPRAKNIQGGFLLCMDLHGEGVTLKRCESFKRYFCLYMSSRYQSDSHQQNSALCRSNRGKPFLRQRWYVAFYSVMSTEFPVPAKHEDQ